MCKKCKVVHDKSPVIYKQDIIDKDGKLNILGTFLVVGTFLAICNASFKFLNDIIVDKDNVS